MACVALFELGVDIIEDDKAEEGFVLLGKAA